MALRLDATIPNFPFLIEESDGSIKSTNMYNYIGPNWGLILTFPQVWDPVAGEELATLA
jgi:hypothetical protein